MTAKEKVLALAPRWSEDDAEVALRAVEDKHQAEDESILAEDKRPRLLSSLAADPLAALSGSASFQPADIDAAVYGL
jgi:hypothetical protein